MRPRLRLQVLKETCWRVVRTIVSCQRHPGLPPPTAESSYLQLIIQDKYTELRGCDFRVVQTQSLPNPLAKFVFSPLTIFQQFGRKHEFGEFQLNIQIITAAIVRTGKCGQIKCGVFFFLVRIDTDMQTIVSLSLSLERTTHQLYGLKGLQHALDGQRTFRYRNDTIDQALKLVNISVSSSTKRKQTNRIGCYSLPNIFIKT